MSRYGNKNGKFCYDGDVSLADFANSTAVQRQHCRKGRSSFNIVYKEVARVGAVNAAATLKVEFDVDPQDEPQETDANSATEKSGTNGNPATKKSGKDGNLTCVVKGKSGKSAAMKKGTSGKKKGKPGKSAAVINGKPGEAEPSIDLVRGVQQLNVQEQGSFGLDDDLDLGKSSPSSDDQCTQKEEMDQNRLLGKLQIRGQKKGLVKKVKKEDLPWDEQPEDEESDYEEEDLAWYNSDDEDCEDLHYAKDVQSTKDEKVQINGIAKKEEMDQNRLLNDLLIRGLKEKLGEDTKEQVVNMCRKRLKRNLTKEDIVKAQRLGKPGPPGEHRIILVTFKSYSDRQRVFNIKRKLKSSGVMITEHLTRQRSELYQIVKKKFGAKKSWTQDGTVFWVDYCGIRCSAKRKADLKFSYLDL